MRTRIKTKTINHIYEYYPLYQVMYGTSYDYKMIEAYKFNLMLENLAISYNKFFDGLNILETHSGISEHRKLLMDTSNVPINKYKCMDINKNTTDYVVQGDIIKDKLPIHTNIVLSYYYSISTTLVPENTNYRKAIVDMGKNIYKHLDTPGAWIFHIGDGVDDNGRSLTVGIDKEAEHYVPIHYLIRSDFNIPKEASVFLYADIERVFNRWTGIQEDHLSNIHLYVDDKVVARFNVKLPFTTRYWSEGEVFDILDECGFKTAIPWNNKYDGYQSNHDPLPLVLTEEYKVNYGLTDNDLHATDIVAIKL